MHLTPVLKALLFAGLVYGQVNGVPSNGPNTVAAASFVQSEFSALVSADLPASLSADSTLSPNNDQANCGASASGFVDLYTTHGLQQRQADLVPNLEPTPVLSTLELSQLP